MNHRDKIAYSNLACIQSKYKPEVIYTALTAYKAIQKAEIARKRINRKNLTLDIRKVRKKFADLNAIASGEDVWADTHVRTMATWADALSGISVNVGKGMSISPGEMTGSILKTWQLAFDNKTAEWRIPYAQYNLVEEKAFTEAICPDLFAGIYELSNKKDSYHRLFKEILTTDDITVDPKKSASENLNQIPELRVNRLLKKLLKGGSAVSPKELENNELMDEARVLLQSSTEEIKNSITDVKQISKLTHNHLEKKILEEKEREKYLREQEECNLKLNATQSCINMISLMIGGKENFKKLALLSLI